MSKDDPLLEFPCQFPIKAMGRSGAEFESLVIEIVRKHAPDLGEGSVKTRDSQGGKYVSVTVTVRATSREQLDNIYRELTARDEVLMAL